MLSRDSHGPRAVLNALDRLIGGYEGQCAAARQDLAIAQGQLRDYDSRLGLPFAHEAYLTELASLRDQLKVALSGATTEPAEQKLPPASEIAEMIKSLKSAHSIEPRRSARAAAPQEPSSQSRPASVATLLRHPASNYRPRLSPPRRRRKSTRPR